ncbi:MAG: ice-binding family protein, partial [Bacteroidales bacterium]
IIGTFNIATDKKVNLIGGAQAKNIFWVVGDETTLFPGSTLEGTILDYAGIAMQSLATLNGRAFSSTASVTLIANTITYPTASIDTNIPIITLIGDSNINVDFNTIYVDLNATAMDDVDGNITSSIISVSDVNTLKLGSYDVNFNVTDSSGNSAVQVTRTVNVVDRNAPIFDLNVFNPTLTVINDTNAVVDINASEIVNCKYNLNEDVNYSLMTSSEQLIDLNGVINVSNLTGDTDYNLFVRCRDVSNNDSNNSKLFAFKTQLDINAPTFNRTVTLNDHNAIVTITLSELAKCRVSVNDINYASMDVNTTSDSFALTQTFTFTQLVPGTDYNKFFQCIDTSGIDSNKTDVNRYATIRTIDVNAPIVALSTSSTTTNSTIISVTTDEPSTCRYALTDVNYDLMTNDLNTTWDSLSVNWNISGLDSSTNYLYYVMCRDSNVNDSNASISFTTAQRSSGGGGGSIIPTCSSYVYSDWNACKADGTRVRSIVSSVPIRCIGNPILTQSCTYDVTDPTGGSTTPTCTSFVYSDWDVCGTDSEQSRTVVSSLPNNCVNGNTVLIQSCIPIPTAVIPNDTNTTDNLSVDKGLGDLGLIIVVIIILLVLGAGGLYYYFNVVKK